MAAVTQIPEHYVTEFDTNWQHLAQQKMEKCRAYVLVDSVEGKEKSYNQMGAIDFQQVTTRAGATRITDTPLAKRWVRPLPYDLATLFDEWDEKFLGTVVLPQGQTVQAQGYGYSRLVDQVVLAAAVGTAYTGETGTTATALPGAQAIAVNLGGASIGLTIAKILQAKYLLDDAEIDEEDPRTIFVSAKQIQDLLATTEIKSSDYNTVKALAAGQLDTFCGFKFKRVNKNFLPYNAGTDVRTVVVATKSGLQLTDSGKRTYMDVLPTQSHALQIRSVCALGATRMEEVKVVTIACDESP